MNIERNRITGAWICSTIDNTGHLISHQYYGYTKKEAKNLFLKEIAQLVIKEMKEKGLIL